MASRKLVDAESSNRTRLRASCGLGKHDGGAKMGTRKFELDEARSIGDNLGISWDQVDPEEFRRGLEVELEHGGHDPDTNVTNDDPILTGKIAWAHLKEIADYYTRLDRMEAEAENAV
jgi:hypothetical protein